MRKFFVSIALGLALASLPALAETTHVVAKGHTLRSIARRYKVTEEAILEANDLKNPRALKPGTELVIPTKGDTKKKGKHGKRGKDKAEDGESASGRKDKKLDKLGKHKASKDNDEGEESAESDDKAAKSDLKNLRDKDLFASKPPSSKYAKVAKEPHVIHIKRGGEDFKIRVRDRRGKIPPKALRDFEKVMRLGEAQHTANPRLVALLGIVSDHFGSRALEVVSGFRPASSTQYTPHSKHNYGRALDFKVAGVPNEALRDFCKTFKNVGVGYYPNSTFVHLDVRDNSAFWTDYSRPGEAPNYEGNHNKDTDEAVTVATDETEGDTETDEANAASKSDAKDSAKPAVPKEDTKVERDDR